MARVPESKADMGKQRRIAEALFLGFGAMCFAVLIRYHWRHICDDAFIYFRYADNIVAGFGPVWNRGEAVEGYSSPLWLGLMVLGRALGVGLPGWAGAFGVAFAALGLAFVHRLAFAICGNRLVAAVAFAVNSLLYPLYYWTPAGLETAMFTALVVAATWSLAARRPWCLAACAAFLGVARPEGPALSCALVGLLFIVRGRAALRPGPLALAFGPVLAWLVFRHAYYGEWLPNTYYAKATGAPLLRVTAGTIYALPSLVALAATTVVMWSGGIVNRMNVAAAAFAVLILGVAVSAGGDWMWHGRMVLPALPSLLVLAIAGVAAAPSRRRLVLAMACGLGWLSFLPRPGLIGDLFALDGLPAVAYQEGTLIPASREAARFINGHYPADALVAVNHAGALPQALPNPALDMTGLCDHHIAHEVEGGLHGKYDAAYVLSRRPRLVVLNSRVQPGTSGIWYHPGYWSGETALVVHPEFNARYRPVPRYWEWQWLAGNGGYILLYERIAD
jgi:arabinofuranosyltransferase